MNKDKMKGNGFDEYKRLILSNIDDLKDGQEKHAKKLEELKDMVTEKFTEMGKSVTVLKTKVAMYAVIFGGIISILINVGIALVKYA